VTQKTRKVVFITGYRPGGPYYWAEKLVKKIGELDLGWRGSHPKTLWQTIYSALIAPNADVVHSTLPVAFHLWRRPLVMTIKGDFEREKGPGYRGYRRAIAAADAVTVPSEFIKRQLGLHQAIVIPNGFDLPNAVSRPETEPDDPIKLLTVTKFHFKDKASGVLNLYRILESVAGRSNRQIVWDILGDGAFRREIESQVKSEKIKINFRGFVDPKPFYQSADVFLYYSDHDNMPNAIIEAMGYGLPVISNDIGAVGEMIDDGVSGYLCRDQQDYTAKLTQMLKTPSDLAVLGRQAREVVATRFDNDVITRKYLEIYERIVTK